MVVVSILRDHLEGQSLEVLVGQAFRPGLQVAGALSGAYQRVGADVSRRMKRASWGVRGVAGDRFVGRKIVGSQDCQSHSQPDQQAGGDEGEARTHGGGRSDREL